LVRASLAPTLAIRIGTSHYTGITGKLQGRIDDVANLKALAGIALLEAGGLIYKAGVVFIMLDLRLRYSVLASRCEFLEKSN